MRDNEYTVMTVFLLGVIIAIYYIFSVFTAGSDVSSILEKTILAGVFIAILITNAIMLFRIMELKREIESGRMASPQARPAAKRTTKDVKADMMKIYRDMGALKIVSKDDLIDKATYDKERKTLDARLAVLKKEFDSMTKASKKEK